MQKHRLIHTLLFCFLFCCMLEAQQLVGSSDLGTLSKENISMEYNIEAEYGVKLFKILYETPDIQGVKDTASGLLVLPDVPGNIYPLLCYQHGTVAGRTDVPSNLAGGSDLAIVFASMGYVTSAADYLGLGEARGLHPYVHADSEASAAIDMLFAVRQYAAENDVFLNDQLFITGYSQGGHAAMAAHRSLQADYGDEFTVTAAAPMSGPYSISEKMIDFTLGDQEYQFVSYLAYTALSYNLAYGTLYNDLEEFFKPQFVSTIEGFVNEQYNLFTMNLLLIGHLGQLGGTIPKLMLQDSILESIQTDPTHPVNVALADNDVYDWVPDAPTRMYYCEADDQVTFENAILANQVMNDNGAADVNALSVGVNLDHGGCVPPATTAAIEFFAGFQQVTTSVSVLEDVDKRFDLQPNPVGEELWLISLDESIRQFQVQILDSNGQLLRSEQFNGNDRNRIYVADLSAGLYLVNIVTEQGSTTKKLIIR
ncbi:MAG: T9SS type A sorting domain-containing protein [Bacteroidota bacterium]